MRRFLNIGTVFALALSIWGSALAASCPHGCHSSPTVVNDVRSHASEANPVEHCHTTMPDAEAQQSPAAFGLEQTGVVADYAGDDATGARPVGSFDSARSRCGHCVGRDNPPTSAFTNREADQLKRFDAAEIASTGGQAFHADNAFAKEIIPYEDGPPPSPLHRHVLINVFRI